MNKLETLTNKIQELVPELIVHSCRICCGGNKDCTSDWHDIIVNSINLEDVLKALHKLELQKEGMRTYLPQIGYMVLDNGWAYGKPLHLQSEETQDFLHSLFFN